MNIGSKIKKLRLQQGLTLQELADRSGYSKSLLSKIENGVISPSLSSLSNISKVLKVKLAVLFNEDSVLNRKFTKGTEIDSGQFSMTDKGYIFLPLSSNHPDNELMPIIVRAKKGDVVNHLLSHEGEEFIYVTKGTLQFFVGDKAYIMEAGDSLYFNSLEKHGMKPISEFIEYLDIMK